MLVVTRKTGEGIDLDVAGGIRIVVLSVSGSRVLLGVDAPRSVGVTRIEDARPEGSGASDE